LLHLDGEGARAKDELILLARQTVAADAAAKAWGRQLAADVAAAGRDAVERGALTARLCDKVMRESAAQRTRGEELEARFQATARQFATLHAQAQTAAMTTMQGQFELMSRHFATVAAANSSGSGRNSNNDYGNNSNNSYSHHSNVGAAAGAGGSAATAAATALVAFTNPNNNTHKTSYFDPTSSSHADGTHNATSSSLTAGAAAGAAVGGGGGGISGATASTLEAASASTAAAAAAGTTRAGLGLLQESLQGMADTFHAAMTTQLASVRTLVRDLKNRVEEEVSHRTNDYVSNYRSLRFLFFTLKSYF